MLFRSDTPHGDYALNLLNERNCRVREGLYRNSVSLAMATLALPFVEKECGAQPGNLWNPGPDSTAAIRGVLDTLFKPQTMMNRMTLSAERVLILQPLFGDAQSKEKLVEAKSYPHSRELLLIRTAVAEEDTAETERQWPPASARRRSGSKRERSDNGGDGPKRRRRGRRSGRGHEKNRGE